MASEQTEPAPAVDAFWHEHILDTRDYAAFCESVFGCFIDHIPSEHGGCTCSNCDKAPRPASVRPHAP